MSLNSNIVTVWQDALASNYNDLRKDVLENAGEYAVATWSGSSYEITVDNEITSLSTWQIFKFEANFTNTWVVWLDANSTWNIQIKDIDWNGIIAWAIQLWSKVIVLYDWTSYIAFSITATESNKGLVQKTTDAESLIWTDLFKYLSAAQIRVFTLNNVDVATATVDMAVDTTTVITHNLWIIPKYIKWTATADSSLTAWTYASGWHVVSWTKERSIVREAAAWFVINSFIRISDTTGNYITWSITTVGSSQITITWTKTWSPTWNWYHFIEFM